MRGAETSPGSSVVASLDRLRLHTTRPLPDYLADLAEASATGTLDAICDDDVRRIAFVDGEIHSATSTVEEERLGSWLVTRQAISDNERALALLRQGGSTPGRLGEILRRRGYIDRSILESELEQLTVAIVRHAAAAEHTYCEFREGHESPPVRTLITLTTEQLILHAARDFPDLEAKRATVGSLAQVGRLTGELGALLETIDLTPAEAFLISRLEASRPLTQVIAACSMAQDDAVGVLYGLKLAGIITIADAGEGPPRPRLGRGQADDVAPEPAPVDESRLREGQRKQRADIHALVEQLPSMNHYQALRLERDARPNLIRDAWRGIQRQFNPRLVAQSHLRDLGEELEAITERAREAYDVLSDSASRQRYDRILRSIEEESRIAERRPGQLAQSDARVRGELVEANLKRADELLEDGETYLAIQLLEQACAFQPRPADLVKLARLLLRNPLWGNRALGTLKRAVETDPGYIEAWLELAEFWRKRRSPERERRALEHALTADPRNEEAAKLFAKLAGRGELERLRLRIETGPR